MGHSIMKESAPMKIIRYWAFLELLRTCSVSSISLNLERWSPSLISSVGNCNVFILKVGKFHQRNPFELLESTLYSAPHVDYFVMNVDEDEANTSNIRYEASDHVRYRVRCVRVYALLSTEVIKAGNIGDKLYSRISKWKNILRKDEDFHFFVPDITRTSTRAKETVINDILIRSRISSGVKHKGLLYETALHDFKALTSCAYCNNGLPEIIDSLKDYSSIVWDPKEAFKLNFYGKKLLVSTPTSTGWLHELAFEDNQWTSKRGLYKIVLDNLMIKYNFTCNFVPSRGGGGTGLKLSNGSWIGSVGDIFHGTADLGHTTGQTWQRDKAVGFTYPVSYETLTFTSGQPLPFYSWKAMFWPLSRSAWAGIGVSFLIANLVMAAIIQLSERSLRMSTSIEYTMGTLLEQEIPAVARVQSHSIRLFMVSWLIFCLITTTAYRSKLVSSIAFPLLQEPPKTFEELANSKYDFALQYLRGAAYALLKSSPNPTYKKIYERMGLEELDTRCFQRAIGKRFVCISWQKIADYVYRKNLTDRYGRVPLLRSSDTTCFLSVGYVLEKRAIFQSSFNSLIIHATDTGLLDRWTYMDLELVHEQRKDWERSNNISGNEYSVEVLSSLTNQHFKGSYFLLVAGSLIALIVFGSERIFSCSKISPVNSRQTQVTCFTEP